MTEYMLVLDQSKLADLHDVRDAIGKEVKEISFWEQQQCKHTPNV